MASATNYNAQTQKNVHVPLPETIIGSRVVTRTNNLREYVPNWVQTGTRAVEQHVPIVTYDSVPTYATRKVPRVHYDLQPVTYTVRVPIVTYKQEAKYDTVSIPKVSFETVQSKIQEQVPTVSFENVPQRSVEYVPAVDSDYVTVRDVEFQPDLTYREISQAATRDRIVYQPQERTITNTHQAVWPELVTKTEDPSYGATKNTY